LSILFGDLKFEYLRLKEEFDQTFQKVMSNGWYILGQEVSNFEKEFAKYCGTKHCVGTANGLEAMFLVLKSWGIKKKDEIIIPSNTYIATWLAVSHTGATPKPVEPNESNINTFPGNRLNADIPKPDYLIYVPHTTDPNTPWYPTTTPEYLKILSNSTDPRIPNNFKAIYNSNQSDTIIYKIDHKK